jgi:alkylation response protein AidB-like acyl-CoA dehydrogenase
VFIVDLKGAGVTVTRQATTNKDAEALVELDGAPALGVLGSVGDGERIITWIDERGTAALCAQQLGVLNRALEMTAEYSKTRVQFDRPIATFQAVGQRIADGYIDVEGVRLTTWQAAWRLSTGLPAATEVEVAKYWAADAAHRVAHTAVHLHGGTGVDVDHPIHRYFIAAKELEFTLGGATDQLLRIGAAFAATPE